jgi:hypothetical protein
MENKIWNLFLVGGETRQSALSVIEPSLASVYIMTVATRWAWQEAIWKWRTERVRYPNDRFIN